MDVNRTWSSGIKRKRASSNNYTAPADPEIIDLEAEEPVPKQPCRGGPSRAVNGNANDRSADVTGQHHLSDVGRNCLIRTYLDLKARLAAVESSKTNQIETRKFVTADELWPTLIAEAHPLLEEAVYESLKSSVNASLCSSSNSKRGKNLEVQKRSMRFKLLSSPLWNELLKVFDNLDPLNADNSNEISETLKKVNFATKISRKLHLSLAAYLKQVSPEYLGSNVDVIPTFDLITIEHLKKWTSYVEHAIKNMLSEKSPCLEEAVKNILETINNFSETKFSSVNLSAKISSDWVAFCSLPWFLKFKARIPKKFLTNGFLTGLHAADLEILSHTVQAQCLEILSVKIFLPWKDYILEILCHVMEKQADRVLVLSVLGMIENFSWPIRNIPWSYLIAFLDEVVEKLDWTCDCRLRSKIVGAIVKMPCIYTNQKQRELQKDYKGRISIEATLDCSYCMQTTFCSDQVSFTKICLPDEQISSLLRLSVPFLKFHSLSAKLKLTELISSIRSHSLGYSQDVVASFTSVAALGSMSLGSEVMKRIGFYIYQTLSKDNPDLDRVDAIECIFKTLRRFLEDSIANQKSMRFSTKILIILQNIVSVAEQTMVTSMIKFALELVVCRDSNVLNMMSQALIVSLAAKAGCQPWELMTRLRYDLAETILNLIKTKLCEVDKDDKDLQSENIHAYLNSIFTMGEYRTHGIFVHHYYPLLLGYLVPTIHDDPKSLFILQVMVKFTSLPALQLLLNGFHNYYRALVLGHNQDRVSKTFGYLQSKFGIECNFVANVVVQGTLNEMLCHLNERKDKVILSIPKLLRKDIIKTNSSGPSTAKTVGRSEIQELLSKNLMGFFVHVDSKLHSRLESIKTKRRILESFVVLIDFIGKQRVTSNRTKVYTTLNSLFSLGVEFHDLLYEAWKTFAFTLEDTALSQMTVQILAAVLNLRESLPSQVDSLCAYFVCTKKQFTLQHYQNLYFLEDHTADPEVKKVISLSIATLSQACWSNYFDLIVKESLHENSHIRLRAIRKLHKILLKDHVLVHMELEREHPVIFQVLTSLLNASRDADTEMLILLAESFGGLGAVDPYRFKKVDEDEIHSKTCPTFTVEGPNFAARYLDLLVREFQEAEHTIDFDYCACLIQQILPHFKVEREETNPVWHTLSGSARSMVEPLFSSKYKVEKELPKLDLQCPIYLSDNGKNYEQWLSNWLTLMMTYVNPDSPASDLFKFSKYMIARNNRIASFLLPYVATFAVIGGTQLQKQDIVKEIENILQKRIAQDAMKANSQMLLPVKEVQTEMGTPEPETKLIFDEDVFQHRVTQEIFAVFDHIFRGIRHTNRQAGLARANQSSKSRQNLERIVPCFSDENVQALTQVLQQIPLSTVSQVAFQGEDYKRALFYVEQDLGQDPVRLQNNLNYLQQLYVSLNDMDSVIGVSTLRKREPTVSEIVLEDIAKGKLEASIRSLECLTAIDPNDLIAHNGLIQAYLSVDEPRKAETLIKGCISKNPHWEEALHEAQVEASWKLRDWTALQKGAKGSRNAVEDVSLSWNMTIVKILSNIRNLELDTGLKCLNDTRVKLMGPLVGAAKDSNTYDRVYPNVIQLHVLTEVEQVINLLKQVLVSNNSPDTQDKLQSLNDQWNCRLNVMLKSQKFVDPVLNVRKTLLETLKESLRIPSSSSPSTLDGINDSIRDCWLTAARVESKIGNFTRAQNCILEAKNYPSPKVLIEHAKLLSRKGDKEQAIQILSSCISQYFPLAAEWSKESASGMTGQAEKRKLCSKALLLHAQLCDEQQLLDFEANIKNYRGAAETFKESEKNFFTLGSYYDRIWSNAEGKPRQDPSDIQSLVVKFYSQSLFYGCKYVYQSLPRLLSIWFDYAALGSNSGESSKGTRSGSSTSSGESQPIDWDATVKDMNASIRKLMKEVPKYVLLTAFSQLISRLCHANSSVWELLKEILVDIIEVHPHQALWMTIAVSKSSYEMRKNRCKEVYKSVGRKKAGSNAGLILRNHVKDYTILADKLIDLCIKNVPKTTEKYSLQAVAKDLVKLFMQSTVGEVLIPFHMFLNPCLPLKGTGHRSHNGFPQKFVYIRGIDDAFEVMHSLQRPKRINIIGSNGKRYGLLCKANDDLRKDYKVMEVNSVVNWYLYRNPESRQRQLNVRVFGVTPLNEEHGLLEWVPNLGGLRGIIMSLHREKGIGIPLREVKGAINNTDTLPAKRQKYIQRLVNTHPPVLSEWFLNNFNDPQSWYKARMCYVRTAAVMSIVGFILGLGDRHGENILMDSSTGDIVHVDFNCLFNKGDTFDIPERVPFRLTQNMVEAMGPLGVEGVFRRSCEITLDLFRKHKSIFLSVIRPFVFDPLVEWENNHSNGTYPQSTNKTKTGEVSNVKAVEHMKHIKNRISGSARNNTKEVNTELSVEAYVAYLIDEARNVDNLCRMFVGWTAYL